MGAFIAGSGRCCSHLWERSLVAFVGSGRRWIFSEAVFGALVGSNPEIIIELSGPLVCELVHTKHVAIE